MMIEEAENVLRKAIGFNYGSEPVHYRLRTSYRNLRNRFFKPLWVYHPSNIQIDTHNYCNLWMQGKGCIHCNVKPGGGWNLPRGRMKTDLIEFIIRYWGEHGASSIAPYINGEPLLDSRLPWICDLSQECGLKVFIDTNGSLPDSRRKALIHPNLREVRITFSATKRETYELVHGCDRFREAETNIRWFLKNREATQYPMLYFIANKYNLEEIPQYLKNWTGKAHITLFPLHEVEGIQTESEKTRPSSRNYWNRLTKKLVGEYPRQPSRPIDVYLDGRRRVRYFPYYEACQGTQSFSVSWDGRLLHCTDIPYEFNYGHVWERDMLEVWHVRNRRKLDHPACSVCNVKNPDHDKILRRYLW